MSAEHVFVTGCYRSGTTLLEKLLHQVDGWCVASQPAPVLYFQAKQRFLDGRGLDRRYPLDHLFVERAYRPEEFTDRLRTLSFDRADLAQLFDALERYEIGLWTPETLNLRDQVQPGSFLEVQEQIHDLLAVALGRADAFVTGGKEILCEEFAPFLLDAGHRVVLILRDPRDMIASLDYRRRDNQTGRHRPVLYSLRNWRKSVAYSIALRNHPRFHWLRMEDLVVDPDGCVSELVGADVTFGENSLTGQDGRSWSGNSSFTDFDGVDRSVVGRFDHLLPHDVVEYIEALVGPEMDVLGYERSTDAQPRSDLLRRFAEPAAVHENFPGDYGLDARRISDELYRWQLARGDREPTGDDAEVYFLHPGVMEALRGERR